MTAATPPGALGALLRWARRAPFALYASLLAFTGAGAVLLAAVLLCPKETFNTSLLYCGREVGLALAFLLAFDGAALGFAMTVEGLLIGGMRDRALRQRDRQVLSSFVASCAVYPLAAAVLVLQLRLELRLGIIPPLAALLRVAQAGWLIQRGEDMGARYSKLLAVAVLISAVVMGVLWWFGDLMANGPFSNEWDVDSGM